MKEVVLQGNDGKIIGKFTVTDETFEKISGCLTKINLDISRDDGERAIEEFIQNTLDIHQILRSNDSQIVSLAIGLRPKNVSREMTRELYEKWITNNAVLAEIATLEKTPREILEELQKRKDPIVSQMATMTLEKLNQS